MAPYYSTVLLFILGLVSLAYKHSKIIKSKKLPVIRSRNSIPDEVDDSNRNLTFNITVLTWNLAEATPSESNYNFLKLLRSEDMVVIGVQECENIKPRRHEGSRSRAWRKIQHSTLGKGFECLALHKMGGIQLAVFAKPHIAMKVREVQIIDVACGVGNVLMNKGAIAILLRIQKKTIAFINAHMAAHLNKVEDRNEDYYRIINTIKEKAPPKWLNIATPLSTSSSHLSRHRSSASKTKSAIRDSSRSSRINDERTTHSNTRMKRRRMMMDDDTTIEKIEEDHPSSSATIAASLANLDNQQQQQQEHHLCPTLPFDGTVFFGDLNYRLEIPRLEVELVRALHPDIMHGTTSTSTGTPIIEQLPGQGQGQTALQSLLDYDQLRREKGAEKVLVGFQEGKISFLPTFKYDKGSDAFDSSSKQRVPAWTDRILFAESKQHRNIGVIAPAIARSSKNAINAEDNMKSQKDTKGADGGVGGGGGGLEQLHTPNLFQLRRYTSIDAKHGDHRPVCAQFLVTL